ncbi:MAG: DUF3810 domain-containing protein [Clostridia bacterium]
MYLKKAVARKSNIQLKLFIISIVLLVLSYLTVFLARQNVDLTTKYYTHGFYEKYMSILLNLNSKVPFSIAEVLIVLFCLYLIGMTIFLIYTIKCDRKNILNVLLLLFVPCCIVVFMFTISYLPNYHQHTFYYYSGLEMEDTSVDNLYDLCEKLASDANYYREIIDQENEVFDYTKKYTTEELFKLCTKSFENLVEDYPEYTDLFDILERAVSKPVFLSKAMSYLSMTGGFFAITGEANININSSDIFIPSTVCHELAHVAGFMREDEANFIAYIACRSSEEDMLNYSGTMLALLHSTNALYSKNTDKYYEIMSTLSDDVKLDFQAHNEYYYKYETKIRTVSKAVNDTYLKANNQTDGINSYGRMVDLLIADFNKK